MAFCGQCGTLMPAGSNSCTRCGMVVEANNPTFYAAHTGAGGIAPTAAALPVTPPLLPRRKSYTRLFIEASILLAVVSVSILITVAYANYEYGVGHDNGYLDGQRNGYHYGYNDGKNGTYNSAFAAGQSQGQQSGYDQGYTAGKQAGYKNGYDAGKQTGYSNGWTVGNNTGKQEAYQSGYTQGKSDGYNTGYSDGYTKGKQDGYNSGYTDGGNAEYASIVNWIETHCTKNSSGYYPYIYTSNGQMYCS